MAGNTDPAMVNINSALNRKKAVVHRKGAKNAKVRKENRELGIHE